MTADPHLVTAYEDYYGSQHYEHRYPAPNPSTLSFLRRHGLHQAISLLDLGCGSGRYAMPLLAQGSAQITGCDPAAAALDIFRRRVQDGALQARVRLVHGDVGALPDASRFDGFLLLFGVLGILGPREQRVATLRRLRALALPGARMALTVPSAWRRLPWAHIRAWWQAPDQPHDIQYVRRIQGQVRHFSYHLYQVDGLRQELADAGWQLQVLEPESVLPESWVCRWPALARLDGHLQGLTPAALGYGLRALAIPSDR